MHGSTLTFHSAAKRHSSALPCAVTCAHGPFLHGNIRCVARRFAIGQLRGGPLLLQPWNALSHNGIPLCPAALVREAVPHLSLVFKYHFSRFIRTVPFLNQLLQWDWGSMNRRVTLSNIHCPHATEMQFNTGAAFCQVGISRNEGPVTSRLPRWLLFPPQGPRRSAW